MTLLRRAFADVIGVVEWRWLTAAGAATMAGTFLLATVEPPESVSAVALGAMGATVLYALLAPLTLRHAAEPPAAGAPSIPPPTDAPAPTATTEPPEPDDDPATPVPRISQTGGTIRLESRTGTSTTDTLESYVTYRDLLVILDVFGTKHAAVDPRTGLTEERELWHPKGREEEWTKLEEQSWARVAYWLTLLDEKDVREASTLLLPLIHRRESERPRLFDPEPFVNPGAVSGLVGWTLGKKSRLLGGSEHPDSWLAEVEVAREALRRDVEEMRSRPEAERRTPEAEQRTGLIGELRVYGGGEAYRIAKEPTSRSYKCLRCGNIISDVGPQQGLPSCPSCGNKIWDRVVPDAPSDPYPDG